MGHNASNLRSTSPIATMKARLSVSQYSHLEEAQIKADTRLCYAVGGAKTVLTSSCDGPVEVGPSHPNVDEVLQKLPGLRCRPNYACFNIYPTSANTLAINNFLWETVHNGFFDASEGYRLFGDNVYVLGLAAELYDFLVHVSREALEVAIIDFLVLLHHQLSSDGDVVGVEKLKEELIPEVWARVEQSIGIHENGEPKEVDRAATLEHLVQISFMTPWRVDVLAGFLAPDDMSRVLLQGPKCASDKMEAGGPEGVGVRGSALLKLYRDWKVYDDVLCRRLNMARTAALEAMDRAVYCGRSLPMYEQASFVLDLCEQSSSWFSLLPNELMERSVVPWIIRRHCESIAPRRRRLATLKSLLELSTKFFEELDVEADIDGFGTEMDMAEGDPYGEMLYHAYGDAGLDLDGLQLQPSHSSEFTGNERDATDGADRYDRCPQCRSHHGHRQLCCCSTRRDPSWADNEAATSEVEYPLDAEPPRYSRLERHGGVIDLSLMAEGQGGEGAGALEPISDTLFDVPGIEDAANLGAPYSSSMGFGA